MCFAGLQWLRPSRQSSTSSIDAEWVGNRRSLITSDQGCRFVPERQPHLASTDAYAT